MIACSSLLVNEVMTCHGTLHTMPTNSRVLVVFLLIYGVRAQPILRDPSNRCITESSSDVVFIRALESVTLDVFIEEEYL